MLDKSDVGAQSQAQAAITPRLVARAANVMSRVGG